jgi:hypothetical protein
VLVLPLVLLLLLAVINNRSPNCFVNDVSIAGWCWWVAGILPTTLALIDGHFEQPTNQQQLVQEEELYIIEGTQVMIPPAVTHDHDVYFDAHTRNVYKFLGNRFMIRSPPRVGRTW